uniref:Uncharacterized protein n=1 Tax=Tolypothrix bouteillei VB521301 TaxID=1479485 RepID=A0A0C1QVE3_9CYAN
MLFVIVEFALWPILFLLPRKYIKFQTKLLVELSFSQLSIYKKNFGTNTIDFLDRKKVREKLE